MIVRNPNAKIVGIAGAILFSLIAFWWSLFAGKPLDPIAWQDQGLVDQGIRLEMAKQLVLFDTLNSKTRGEVLAMLGRPSETGYFKDWDLVYWLAPERGIIGIDSEWLVIRFDAHDQVGDARIVRD